MLRFAQRYGKQHNFQITSLCEISCLPLFIFAADYIAFLIFIQRHVHGSSCLHSSSFSFRVFPHEFSSLKIRVPRSLLSYAPGCLSWVQNSAKNASYFTAACSLCSAAHYFQFMHVLLLAPDCFSCFMRVLVCPQLSVVAKVTSNIGRWCS